MKSKTPVIILGAKGLGKVAMDIFQNNRVDIYCFLDDDASLHGKEIGDVAVLGRTDDEGFLKYLGKKCAAFVATDDNKYRENIVEMLKERKVVPVNAIHEAAFVSDMSFFGYGNMINAGVVINSNAKIANHCIISCNATIDFDAELGDFVQIGAGTVINSGVKIENGAFIGSGVTIVSGVKVGKKARVGAGSVVIADVKDGETVFGNPAKTVNA